MIRFFILVKVLVKECINTYLLQKEKDIIITKTHIYIIKIKISITEESSLYGEELQDTQGERRRLL
jgi:hypothetical protein